MNRVFIKVIMAILPLALFSCAHQSTENQYKKMYGSLFSSANYVEDDKSINLGENGFLIEGNLANMPNNLIVVFEYAPENLVFIDSARTDELGNFKLQSIINDETICYLQFGERMGFPIALNNQSKMQLKIRANEQGVSYLLDGENIETAKQIKVLTEMNSGFLFKLNALQMQAMGYDPAVSTQAAMQQAQLNMINLQEERNNAIAKQMLEGPPSFAPYFALKYLLEAPTYQQIKDGYEKCNKYNSKSAYTQILESWAAQERGTAIGYPAPNIVLKSPEGKVTPLSSLKGKVVLIDFWASWCRPCMGAMPELKVLNSKFANQPFVIYGVSLDRDSLSWVNTIKTSELNWTHVSDLQYWSSAAAKTYKVGSIPATFLIDKEGNIAAKNLHGPMLEAKILELMAKPTKPTVVPKK